MTAGAGSDAGPCLRVWRVCWSAGLLRPQPAGQVAGRSGAGSVSAQGGCGSGPGHRGDCLVQWPVSQTSCRHGVVSSGGRPETIQLSLCSAGVRSAGRVIPSAPAGPQVLHGLAETPLHDPPPPPCSSLPPVIKTPLMIINNAQ